MRVEDDLIEDNNQDDSLFDLETMFDASKSEEKDSNDDPEKRRGNLEKKIKKVVFEFTTSNKTTSYCGNREGTHTCMCKIIHQ